MKQRVLIVICSLFVSLSLQAQVMKKVYDEDMDQMVQIDKALAEGSASGRFVMCQVGGNWCPWCLRFAAFVENDSDLSKFVNDNYVYIHVNYNPSNVPTPELKVSTEQMMKRLGSPGRFGFPVFVVLDQEGRVLHTQDSSFLESGNSYDKEKVMRFFECWTPDALKK